MDFLYCRRLCEMRSYFHIIIVELNLNGRIFIVIRVIIGRKYIFNIVRIAKEMR